MIMENQKQENQDVEKEAPNEDRNKGAWNGHLDSEKSLPTDGPVSKNEGDNSADLNDTNEPHPSNTTDDNKK